MTWPRSKLPKQVLFLHAQNTIIQLGNAAAAHAPNFDSDVDDDFLRRLKTRLDGAFQELLNIQALSAGMNIGAYAQDQFVEPGFDPAAEFVAVKSLVAAAQVEIANLPDKDIGAMFTPAETATLKAAIAAIATVTGL